MDPVFERKLHKKILSTIYSSQFSNGSSVSKNQLENWGLFLDPDTFDSEASELETQGWIRRSEVSWSLTENGRAQITVVMAGGSFDIIHPGHIETLQKAKGLGDVLIVSVARNVTFLRNKKRNPLHDEELRRSLVSELKPVDVAILGSEIDIFETVKRLDPDIIALGYDQAHSEEEMTKELKKRGLRPRIVRLESSIPDIKSSKIMQDYF